MGWVSAEYGGFGWVALTYALINIAYSIRLKHVVLLDVLIVASGFLRAWAEL